MRSRIILGLSLLLLPSLGWSLAYAIQALRLGPGYRGQSDVREYDGQRFEAVRPLLPRSGRIGYIEVVEENPSHRTEYLPRLYLAQFALTPLVLVDDPRAPLVLGNFRNPLSYPQAPAGTQYRLIADAGNGVQLYQAWSAP